MTTQRISVGELIAAIPLLLDRTPRETVVALSINSDGLPTCALSVARATLLETHSASVTAAAIAEEFAREHAQSAVIVSYTDADIRGGCAALDALRLEVEYAVPNVEVLGVRAGKWFRPGCFDPSCCPVEGRDMHPVPKDLPGIIAAARARARGPRVASAGGLATASRRQSRAAAAQAWGEAIADGSVPDAATARRLAAELDDLCVRDFVVLTILGAAADAAIDALEGCESSAVASALDSALAGTTAPDALLTERARGVVNRVVRAARGRRRKAATLTLAAVLDWWEGNLTHASERCEAALDNDGDYRLAALVGLAASRGIGPGWMRKVGQTAH